MLLTFIYNLANIKNMQYNYQENTSTDKNIQNRITIFQCVNNFSEIESQAALVNWKINNGNELFYYITNFTQQ